MVRVPYEELKAEFKRILLKKGFDAESAEIAAKTFADNSCDGVYSHGVNRFPRVMAYIDKGLINPKAKAEKIAGFGALENWDGHLSLGVLAARQAMNRAIELAANYGIGCVALRNTNHWLRGGTYGWQAAEAGYAAICWTNTLPNMPAWGGRDRRIGNNPLVFAVPRSNGEHVVVDMAMSQFSYGKLEEYRLKGEPLPVPGGYNEQGELSTDPAEIEQALRLLPVGFWKGSSLSIVLDLLAAVLSGGNASADIGKLSDEYALSQVMIAVDPGRLNDRRALEEKLDESIAYLHASLPAEELASGGQIYYPGERSLLTRAENRKLGIPVNEEVWNEIRSM